MRLDKFISNSTGYSRSEVKKLIKLGAVLVNGDEPSGPQQAVALDDHIEVDGEEIQAPGKRYFMLNKPLGYVCASKDREHPTVLELLDEPRLEKLHIVGRLDIDTTGLVLITDDGQWSHRITSPRHHCAKVYHALCAEDITPDAVDKFARGLMLEGEKERTRPARLELPFSNEGRLTITEGKYHQVKRMFAAIGNRVEELHREAIGALRLDEDLQPGEYRALTEEEVALLALGEDESRP